MSTTAERLRIDGKAAIVTGAGTGLGRAMAVSLAEAGASVAVVGRRREPLEETAHIIHKAGGTALVMQADVSVPEQVEAATRSVVSSFGGLHILVNNAGAHRQYHNIPLLEITPAQWREAISAEMDGVFYFSRLAAQEMVKAGYGRIINIGSASAIMGLPDTVMYNVAKAGIIELTRIFAVVLGGKGVTANCIAPGMHAAGQWMDQPKEKGKDDWLETLASGKFIPVGHLGEAEGIGSLAVLLASEAGSYINGAIIFVDGGATIGRYAPIGYEPVHPLPPELSARLDPRPGPS
ncbi:MAG: SDR family oxidoreductase [Chloroflexi bacterium]|nr:SDR family oxidoreductase [Chloroflexota bacterium]